METTTQQSQSFKNPEWASRYDARAYLYTRRKFKRNPVQNFLFWSAMVIAIGIAGARLALLIM